MPLRVPLVHLGEVARKKPGLVAAGRGPDLDDDVTLVVRVLRDEHLAQLVVQLGDAVLEPCDLVAEERRVGSR